MPTPTTRLGLNKYQDLEPGWGQGIRDNFDVLDNLPSAYFHPRAQATPGMTLRVAAGIGYTGTTPIYFAGGNSPTFVAPVTNPRIDLLYLNGSGALVALSGAENASPTPPSYPSSIIPICEVYLRVGTTAIYNTDQSSHGYIYRDVRSVMRSPGGAGGVSGVHVQGQSDITGSVELVPGSGIGLTQSGQQATITNLGVRGFGISGGTLFTGGNVLLTARDGVTLVEDAPNKRIEIVGTNPPAFVNPMTTQGDIVYGGLGGSETRLGIGAEGQQLTVAGGIPQWANTTAGKRATTRTVAANNSLATSKAGADYVCDNTDDQVEINQAITDLGSIGGTVILMEGTYTIGGQISVPSNVTLESYGAKLFVKNSMNADLNVINIGNNVINAQLIGLWIDLNKSNQSAGTQVGINIGTGVTVTVIDRCYILNARNSCVAISTNSVIRINNSYLAGASGYGVYLSGANSCQLTNCLIVGNVVGIYLVNDTKCNFVGCTVWGNLTYNVFEGSNCADNQFSACHFYNSVYEGVYLSGSLRTSFAACRFTQNGLGTNNTYAQARVDGSTSGANFQSCTFYKGSSGNISKYGIWVEAGATSTTIYPNAYPGGGGSTANIRNDGTGTYEGPDVSAQRSNSYVIAASDASTAQKSGADYVCDGTADDVEWQTVLNAIHTGGGGSVLAVGKNFVFATHVLVGNNTTIEGDSTGTTIKWANAVGNGIGLFEKRGDVSNPTNFVIRNFTLDGNKTNQGVNLQYGLFLDGFMYPRLERILAQNFSDSGIVLYNTTKPFLLECRGDSNGGSGIYLTLGESGRCIGCYANNNTGYGFYTNTITGVSFLNCEEKDNAAGGFYAISSTDITLVNCRVSRTTLSTTVDGFQFNGCTSAMLTGCQAFNYRRGVYINNSSNAISVMNCTLDSRTALEINTAENSKIIGCHLINSAGYALLATSTIGTIIQGNTIVVGSSDGIKIVGGTAILIDKNVVSSCPTYCVSLSGSVSGVVVSGNYFTGSATGIYMINASSVSAVDNGMYSLTDFGVLVDTGCAYIRLDRNRIIGAEDAGIYASAAVTALTIEGNYLRANGRSDYATVGYSIYLAGSDYPTVRGNVIFGGYDIGLHLDTCTNIVVVSNTIYNNYKSGIYVYNCINGSLIGNLVKANGQRVNNTYDNISLVGSTEIYLDGNRVETGINANKPKYGLQIDSGSTGTRLSMSNDLVGSGNSGDIYNVSNGPRLLGAYMGIDLRFPIHSSFWSWVNQGGASVSNASNALVLSVPASASTFNFRGLFRTAPTPPYTITAAFQWRGTFDSTMRWGMAWRDSGSSKVTDIEVIGDNSSIYAINWTNETTQAGLLDNHNAEVRGWQTVWLRLVDNNTNRQTYYSRDGRVWYKLSDYGRTTFMTPNQVGFWANSGQNTHSIDLTCLSWYIS